MTTETPADDQPAIWSDTDPLMQAIAAAVYEQCETHPELSLTVDDPRTIAAVAATVARRILGTTEQADTETAPVVDRATVRIAVLGEAADLFDAFDLRAEADTLRRLAAEAQQPKAEAHQHVWNSVPADGAYARLISHTWTRCGICGQPPATDPDTEAEAQQPTPAPAPCPSTCIACMTDESHDPAPAKGFREWLGRQHVAGTGTGVQPETETPTAPQCTAGLLPATSEPVDRCVRRGAHDTHSTAAGALWPNT